MKTRGRGRRGGGAAAAGATAKTRSRRGEGLFLFAAAVNEEKRTRGLEWIIGCWVGLFGFGLLVLLADLFFQKRIFCCRFFFDLS